MRDLRDKIVDVVWNWSFGFVIRAADFEDVTDDILKFIQEHEASKRLKKQ